MNQVPDTVFVNIYPRSIGPSVGVAYATKADADGHANSHRLRCVEYGARSANTVVMPDKLLADLDRLANKHQTGVIQVIEAALAIHHAIPDEIRLLLRRYAAEHKIKFATAVAESCRGYLTEATR